MSAFKKAPGLVNLKVHYTEITLIFKNIVYNIQIPTSSKKY